MKYRSSQKFLDKYVLRFNAVPCCHVKKIHIWEVREKKKEQNVNNDMKHTTGIPTFEQYIIRRIRNFNTTRNCLIRSSV